VRTGQRERPREDVARLVDWFRREGADLPWRRTRDRYRVLVAEAQLQATQVARVVPHYLRFVERWPTAADLAAARLGDVLAEWQGLGYPRRARNLHAAAAVVAERGWPAPERLADLPGVGPYTAAALRCFADGEDVLPVDTNAARVLARRFPGGWPGAPGAGWEAGQAVMDLGRLWCTARAPRCDDGCPMRDGCPAAEAGTVAAATPVRRPQGRYEGSMRQRRGRLLRELASSGRASAAGDPEAAASLVADGLAERRGGELAPAGSTG
jgi:A/G-specific adenine glycosylase